MGRGLPQPCPSPLARLADLLADCRLLEPHVRTVQSLKMSQQSWKRKASSRNDDNWVGNSPLAPGHGEDPSLDVGWTPPSQISEDKIRLDHKNQRKFEIFFDIDFHIDFNGF